MPLPMDERNIERPLTREDYVKRLNLGKLVLMDQIPASAIEAPKPSSLAMGSSKPSGNIRAPQSWSEILGEEPEKEIVPNFLQVDGQGARVQATPRAEQDFASRLKNLSTIGTPNTGSDATKDVLKKKIPATIEEMEVLSNLFEMAPGVKEQRQGTEDLQDLLAISANRRAQNSAVDLTPLAAWVDSQNSRDGVRSNYAQVAQYEDEKNKPDANFMPMAAEIQRRKADIAKEFGGLVKSLYPSEQLNEAQDKYGVQPVRASNPLGNARRADLQRNKFFQWADGVLKDSDKQKAGLDSLAEILSVNNPASIGRVPLKRAISDMGGNGRVAVQEVMMETGSRAFLDKWAQQLEEWKSGKLSPKNVDLLMDAMAEDIGQWGTSRTNRVNQIKSRAPVYGVGEQDLAAAYPMDYREKSYTRSGKSDTQLSGKKEAASPNAEKEKFEAFKKMMEASGR